MSEQIEKAKRLLAQHGFKLDVGGCGCCGSPWVRLSYEGRDIVYQAGKGGRLIAADRASFTMFDAVKEQDGAAP